MNDITQLTFKIIKEDEDEVATLGIEIWCSLCEEELELSKRKDLAG